jgi:hypothetical protein
MYEKTKNYLKFLELVSLSNKDISFPPSLPALGAGQYKDLGDGTHRDLGDGQDRDLGKAW